MENHVSVRPIKKGGKNYLNIHCSSRLGSPHVHFKTVNVQAGQMYSYLMAAYPSQNAEAYVYIESPKGNVVWPGLRVADGTTCQKFRVPDGVNEITFGFVFLNPDPDAEILVEEIALYKGVVEATDWKSQESKVVQQFISSLGDLSKYDEAKKDSKPVLPPNLFSLTDISEIKNPDNWGNFAKLRIDKRSSGERFLKIGCVSLDGSPHVHFKTLKVTPGQTYSYLISSLANNAEAYIYVESPTVGNVVWPGQPITGGTVFQAFTVPTGATEITLGLVFLKPNPEKPLYIREIGFFEGIINPNDWVPEENKSLQLLLQVSYRSWLWLLFPISIGVLATMYFSYKRRKKS